MWHKYILDVAYYFTKWVEVVPLTQINEKVVIDFTQKNLITRFGLTSVIVFDNASYFSSLKLSEFDLDKGIILRYSSNYYPKGDGVTEATNKILVNIIKKTI
jgi:hypothetical protein